MFDIAPSELILVGAVALVVIGPKDLPRAMHFAGKWIGRARGMARHFRVGLDEIVRQAELEEMQKAWAAENQRIMAEHPLPPPEETDDAAFARGEPAMRPLPDASATRDADHTGAAASSEREPAAPHARNAREEGVQADGANPANRAASDVAGARG